jgi:hypothetical protein
MPKDQRMFTQEFKTGGGTPRANEREEHYRGWPVIWGSRDAYPASLVQTGRRAGRVGISGSGHQPALEEENRRLI